MIKSHRTLLAKGLTAACMFTFLFSTIIAAAQTTDERRVIVESGDWDLVGTLVVPTDFGDTSESVPGVLLLNQAAGDRSVYRELAEQLARRGLDSKPDRNGEVTVAPSNGETIYTEAPSAEGVRLIVFSEVPSPA